MNKDELITAQKTMGITNTQAAEALKIPYRTYYKWVTGERDMPAIAESAVKMLLIIHAHGLMHELNKTETEETN